MAAPSEQRIAVPIDDPNADTEWQVLAHTISYNCSLTNTQ